MFNLFKWTLIINTIQLWFISDSDRTYMYPASRGPNVEREGGRERGREGGRAKGEKTLKWLSPRLSALGPLEPWYRQNLNAFIHTLVLLYETIFIETFNNNTFINSRKDTENYEFGSLRILPDSKYDCIFTICIGANVVRLLPQSLLSNLWIL